jgi:hypothetical protein
MAKTSYPSCLCARPSYRGIESCVEILQANIITGRIITDQNLKLIIDTLITDDVSYGISDILAGVRSDLPLKSQQLALI